MKRVYLDNAATTIPAPEVIDAMTNCMRTIFGNPSSIHFHGREGKKQIENARKQVAAAIHATSPQEVYFTSGGSESDNWAIKGVALANKQHGNHIITSAIEHHAVLHTCAWLEQQGFDVTYLPVDHNGMVSPSDVQKAITDKTILVSIMAANNEIGTIQPIREIAAIAHAAGVLFHTDAVQAIGTVPMDVQDMGVDMLSMSAHKFHGPKGIGALYIRKGIHLDTLIHGGAQERGLRAGTENVPAIVGMGTAIASACANLERNNAYIASLRDKLLQGVVSAIPNVHVNGSIENRLPNNLNLSFDGVEGESLILRLDLAGIAASSGSACTSGTLDPSHVLMAIGCTPAEASGAVRFSFSTDNTEEDVDFVLKELPGIIASLRAMREGYA